MVSYWKAIEEAGQGNLVALLLLSLCCKIKVKKFGQNRSSTCRVGLLMPAGLHTPHIGAFNSMAASLRHQIYNKLF